MRTAFVTAFVLLLNAAAPAGAQSAGTLISADPVVETPGGMQAWRVSYWTSSENGRLVRATGMVVAPREAIPPQPRNVLAWTHGTWGVVSRCAPSLSPNFWTVTPALDAVKTAMSSLRPIIRASGPTASTRSLSASIPGGRCWTAFAPRARSRALRRAAASPSGGSPRAGMPRLDWPGRAKLRAGSSAGRGCGGRASDRPRPEFAAGPNKNVRTFFTAYIGYTWNRHYGAPLATFGGPQTRGILTRLAQNNCIELHSKPKLSTILGILTLQNRLKNVDLGRVQPWAGARAAATARARVGSIIR